MLRPHALGLAALAVVAALLGSGCTDSTGPVAPMRHLLRLPPPKAPVSPPIADSPDGVLRLVEWCWDHLDVEHYRTVFTDDFRFVFSALDPAGNPYRDTPWTREDEIACLMNLGAHAQSVTVMLDRNFRVTPDPRPGRAAYWHRLVRTSVSVHVVADDRDFSCTGYANFFVVRGDSAVIPLDLVERGVRPDSARWYVERWEDETFADDGTRAMPASKASWGSLKVAYR